MPEYNHHLVHGQGMNIELYSVKGFTGSVLKSKLEKALHGLHLPYAIVELSHVDEFIKAGLSSVPAFKIGEKIIQHPQNGSPDETVNSVMDYLLSGKVSTILVPVDFSGESNLAIAYATLMANHFNLGITLAHIHQTMYDPVSAGALDAQFLEESEKQLNALADKLNKENEANHVQVPVLTHLEVGETSSSLLELLQQGQFTMMVMGTRSVDNVFRRIFGTVSSEVSLNSSKPVIVIPPHSEVTFPGKMVVGFTEELFQDSTLDYILSFGVEKNVFFDFVRVTDDVEEFNSMRDKLYEKLVTNRQVQNASQIMAIHPGDKKVHEVLFSYTQEVNADMLVMVSRQRSFLEKLQHASVTKKALHQPPVPLLVLH